ncbi:MAG: hypothetical protein LKM36_08005 [Flavobacteriales bacterium]|jgi:hypothetical protein|nr:hypothetical protein [Flavobacteriales bacterium]
MSNPVPTFLRASKWCAFFLFAIPGAFATEYVVPAGDVGVFFATLPEDATSVVFSAQSVYASEGDIILPTRRLLVIDGRGCELRLGKNSNGFTYAITDMKDAMVRTSSRYMIKDFGRIIGGKKAIDLSATLGSVVENCELVSQTEAAVDLRFCLMARLQNILVTNPRGKGIVLRQGDWPGATGTNSQSNSTVLDQCRVYCMKGTTAAFTILNSGGVRMTDCVSEGAPVDYDIFLSATLDGDESRPASNPVVKSFMLSNFHVEHQALKASIYVNMPSQSTVSLENVYWNGAQPQPVVLYTMGQLNLSDIGWWNTAFYIGSRISAPRINIDRASSGMALDKEVKENRSGFLRLVDPLPGNTVLLLNYVRLQQKSM